MWDATSAVTHGKPGSQGEPAQQESLIRPQSTTCMQGGGVQPHLGVHAQRGGVRARIQRLRSHPLRRAAGGGAAARGPLPPGLLRLCAHSAHRRAAGARHARERCIQHRCARPAENALLHARLSSLPQPATGARELRRHGDCADFKAGSLCRPA